MNYHKSGPFIIFSGLVQSHARFDGRAHDHVNRVEASGQDYLKTRGLCLVPISATPDIAKDNPSEFWAATFGGNF